MPILRSRHAPGTRDFFDFVEQLYPFIGHSFDIRHNVTSLSTTEATPATDNYSTSLNSLNSRSDCGTETWIILAPLSCPGLIGRMMGAER